ncbi:MAG: prepilin-type N-terminal cleavage/methylation domain-containing protein [Vicinamibacteria bacterium]|nr:prepilin-type N-terminal cleavage/methylation domain-containing protein [Vicinamibacteria bacterium]
MTGAKLPPRDRIRGFTLIETLIVIGIIAATAAMALPNIMGYVRGSRIRAAQDDVAGALQRARNLAIMKNTQMGVTFLTENNTTYWVHIEDTIAGVTAGNVGFTRQGVNFAAPNAVLSTRYLLPPDVEFGSAAADCPAVPGFAPAQASVRFDRYGQVSLPGTVVGTNTIPPVVLLGGSTTADRIYAPAAGDRSVCLIDRRTGLRRWLAISTSGRIARRN